MLMVIVRGELAVSVHADSDGNYRAINPKHPGYVGYGQTQDEAKENWSRAFRSKKSGNALAIAEASFMTLSEDDQAQFIADLPGLRRS